MQVHFPCFLAFIKKFKKILKIFFLKVDHFASFNGHFEKVENEPHCAFIVHMNDTCFLPTFSKFLYPSNNINFMMIMEFISIF